MSQAIEQQVTFQANPDRVYAVLMDSQQHGAFTDAPADISSEVGGAFTMFGGAIEGRNIELVPGRRIVQAWRPKSWPDGVYSIVHYELEAEGDATRITLTHKGFPAETRDHLDQGWKERYWGPLEKYLG